MNKNEEITLDIYDLNADGSGVGKASCGRVVFCQGALPGERVRLKIIKIKKSYAIGKIIQIINKSQDRAEEEDICPYAGKCGGCQLQHFKYPAQLKFKEKLVADALKKIGKIQNPPVSPIIGMENPYRYRNKVQFPVGANGLGLYAKRSHKIIPINDCKINMCNEVFDTIQNVLKESTVPVYNEETHTGLLRHVVIRTGQNTGETMVILVVNGGFININLPCDLIINENTEKTNVILGDKFNTVRGSGFIHEIMGHIRYRISPRAFFQINTAQANKLYDIIAGLIKNGENVIDAYCGIGGIALYIANKTQKITGIESVPEAVCDAVFNASHNNINNADFICGQAEDVLPTLLEQGKWDTLILDPPRKGADEGLIKAAANAEIPKIIYVSCNPATLARDILELNEAGEGKYELLLVQPIDMFPMTGHVETVVLLQHRDI